MVDYKHHRDMTRDELVEFVSELEMAALDLSQHLAVANDLLSDEDKPAAYKQAETMAYAIAWGQPQVSLGITVIDNRGLTTVSADQLTKDMGQSDTLDQQ